jgi:hypothetical protein
MNKEMNASINLVEIREIDNPNIYHLFVNWVSAEFDLFLQNEAQNLEVFFPNGFFIIENFRSEDGQINICIKIFGKSKNSCSVMQNKLKKIFLNVLKLNQAQ